MDAPECLGSNMPPIRRRGCLHGFLWSSKCPTCEAVNMKTSASLIPKEFYAAVRKLCFAAQITGGTAGADKNLQDGINAVTPWLEAHRYSVDEGQSTVAEKSEQNAGQETNCASDTRPEGNCPEAPVAAPSPNAAPPAAEAGALAEHFEQAIMQAMSDQRDNVEIGYDNAQEILSALRSQPGREGGEVVSHLSWGGFNVKGDVASIKAVQAALHDAGLVPYLRERLAALSRSAK